ncbi:MAG: hypothetical protein KDA41_13985, partial [Planctomycetales bacterium]|nr:hypothetical protein [Planctomycetales bacterium]
MSFAALTPFAVFGAIAAVAWWLLESFNKGRGAADRRLDEIRDPRLRRRGGEESAIRKTDSMTKMLEKASPALAKPLQPKNEKEAGQLKLRLSYAGFRNESAASIFLGIKFVGLMFGLFLGGGSLLFMTGFNISGMFRAAMFAGGFFYAPDLGLYFLGKRRKDQI